MPANPNPRWFRETFRQIANDLNEARGQEVKLQHLMIRATRASIQAARLAIEGVNAGVFNCGAQLRQDLLFAWTGKMQGKSGRVSVDRGGGMHFKLVADAPEGCHGPLPVDSASDEQLARLWVFPIFPSVRAIRPSSFKAKAGCYDWNMTARDEQGRILGKDGRPLQYVKETLTDPDNGKDVTTWRLSGEPANVSDNYDDADWLALSRARVGDWADACFALAELIVEPMTEPAQDASKPNSAAIVFEGSTDDVAKRLYCSTETVRRRAKDGNAIGACKVAKVRNGRYRVLGTPTSPTI